MTRYGAKSIDDVDAFIDDWYGDITLESMSQKYGLSRKKLHRHAETLDLGPRQTDILSGGKWMPDGKGIMRWVRDYDVIDY